MHRLHTIDHIDRVYYKQQFLCYHYDIVVSNYKQSSNYVAGMEGSPESLGSYNSSDSFRDITDLRYD